MVPLAPCLQKVLLGVTGGLERSLPLRPFIARWTLPAVPRLRHVFWLQRHGQRWKVHLSRRVYKRHVSAPQPSPAPENPWGVFSMAAAIAQLICVTAGLTWCLDCPSRGKGSENLYRYTISSLGVVLVCAGAAPIGFGHGCCWQVLQLYSATDAWVGLERDYFSYL